MMKNTCWITNHLSSILATPGEKREPTHEDCPLILNHMHTPNKEMSWTVFIFFSFISVIMNDTYLQRFFYKVF